MDQGHTGSRRGESVIGSERIDFFIRDPDGEGEETVTFTATQLD